MRGGIKPFGAPIGRPRPSDSMLPHAGCTLDSDEALCATCGQRAEYHRRSAAWARLYHAFHAPHVHAEVVSVTLTTGGTRVELHLRGDGSMLLPGVRVELRVPPLVEHLPEQHPEQAAALGHDREEPK